MTGKLYADDGLISTQNRKKPRRLISCCDHNEQIKMEEGNNRVKLLNEQNRKCFYFDILSRKVSCNVAASLAVRGQRSETFIWF